MEVESFHESESGQWDAFVDTSPTGTLLHTRSFLTYHGTRFQDCSLLFRDRRGVLRALLPAAISPDDPACVCSHPGATYGGLVLAPRAPAAEPLQLLQAAAAHFTGLGYSRLLYRSVPMHVHRHPCQADLHALWRCGARLVRRDLWNVVDLRARPDLEANRQRHLRRARECGLALGPEDSPAAYEAFHAMLRQQLFERHGAAPVHSVEEMLLLRARFPGRISLWLARDADGHYLAGEWILDLGTGVLHGQYGASTDAGQKVFAQDLLIDTIMTTAKAGGARFFSFGASTEREGRQLNAGLFDYKASFGPGSVAHDFYLLELPIDPASGEPAPAAPRRPPLTI